MAVGGRVVVGEVLGVGGMAGCMVTILYMNSLTFSANTFVGIGTSPTMATATPNRPISLACTTRGTLPTIMRVGCMRGSGIGAMSIRDSPFKNFFSPFKFFNGPRNRNNAHGRRIRAPGERTANSNIVVDSSKCVMAGGRIIRNTSRLAIALGSGHRCSTHVVNASGAASLTLVGISNGGLPALPVTGDSGIGINR